MRKLCSRYALDMPKICTTMSLDHSSYCLSPSNLEMVDMGKLNKDIERTIITKNCTVYKNSRLWQCHQVGLWFCRIWKMISSELKQQCQKKLFSPRKCVVVNLPKFSIPDQSGLLYIWILKKIIWKKRSRSKKYPYTTIGCLNLPKLQRLQFQIKEAASIFDLPPSHAKSNSQIYVKVI